MMLISRSRLAITRLSSSKVTQNFQAILSNEINTSRRGTTPEAPPLEIDPLKVEDYQSEITDVLRRFEIRKERRGCLVGTVVSHKNTKSITIKVDREKYFAKYDSFLHRTKKFMAHDENELCEMGDLVRVVPCRPISKMKRHKLLDIIKKGDRLDIVLTKEDKARDHNRFY